MTFCKEESFRLEMIALFALVAVLAVCPWPLWKKIAMTGFYLLIPLTEIVNSALEDICNLITRENEILVKNAKDKGALAVLAAIIFNAFILAALIVME